MDHSDTTLLRRWQRYSDSEAFAELVGRHSAMVFTTSNRILRNNADAEDVTQECFMELGGIRTLLGNSLGGLLHTLATHRSLDRLKSESRRREREIRFAMGRPASYTHSFPLTGPHDLSCTSCHDTGTTSAFNCLNCHEHSQTRMDDKHSEVRDYRYASNACYQCHPNGRH